MEIIKGLYGAAKVSFVGKHYRINEMEGLPKPVQSPHPPVLIGGGGRRVLELAGTVADIVGINPCMRASLATGEALLDLTAERVHEKIGVARGGRPAGRARSDHAALSDVNPLVGPDRRPGRPALRSSLAADVTDPAVLESSPAVLRGSVASCVETLQRRRDEFGLDYIHIGGDPVAAAPIVARLAGT